LLDPQKTSDEILASWLRLQAALALYPSVAKRALATTGHPAQALALVGRWKPDLALSTPRETEIQLRALKRLGAYLLPLSSAHYPARLSHLVDAPAVLSLLGQVDALSGACVALVGARAATVYGKEVAFALGKALGAAGVTVVSGLARGIDAAPHRGVLAANGRTVAVQACGPDITYPPEHRDLAAEIQKRGAVISEFPPGAAPRRHHFPLRNRLISALSEVVVVIEARERSGSLITAEHALEQGVELMAVPGSILSPASAGPNLLLRQGARPVLEPADILEQLSEWMPGMSAVNSDRKKYAVVRPKGLTPGSTALWEALSREPASAQELAARLAQSSQQISLGLVELELEGVIERDRDGRFYPRAASRE
jgi:DNA processing protein